jgi:hypothetical protein
VNLQNISFKDCYNGVYLDGVGPLGVDYSDLSCLNNLRFYDGWGGDGIRIRGSDSTIFNGISMEDCTFSNGIYLIAGMGFMMNNLSINGPVTAIQLGWCRGTAISGWNSEQLSYKALYTIACDGVSVDGFNFYGNDIYRFYICGDTVGLKVRNGRIWGTGGCDLNLFDTSRNVEVDNVQPLNIDGASRGWIFSAVNTAKGQYADTTTELNGLPLFQLKGSDTTSTVFEIDANGGMTVGPGVQILTGSGSPEGVVAAARGTLYLNSSGGSNTTLYVKEVGTGSTGWAAKNISGSISMIPGDANNDEIVDVGDLGILAANYGRNLTAEAILKEEQWFLGDFNSDGVVDVGDLGILAANYGTNSDISLDVDADHAQAFGTTVSDDTSTLAIDRSACGMLGLPIIVGLLLMGLAMVRLKE